jgi:hypothetical protein
MMPLSAIFKKLLLNLNSAMMSTHGTPKIIPDIVTQYGWVTSGSGHAG